MTKEQIFYVFIKNGCLAIPSGMYYTEWYLNEKDYCSWNDKICTMLSNEQKLLFYDYDFTFDELTPELIEERINTMRKRIKIIKINERLKDLEKDFVKL